jgi:putative spermidine/putrescine transport system ATP-binding protein
MILLENVSKTYETVTALSSSNLRVEKGEFITLLGSSGSGKTTLLNIIVGMTAATTGRVMIDGRDVTDVPASQRNIGMVFQNYALMPHMTIFENLAFPLQIRKYSRVAIAKRVREVLDIVQLPDVSDRKPQELSGGQQQRISLARCIAYDPAVVLMDEPLGALDKRLREQMQQEIKRIQSELGITMLYVTHDQEEAMSMSDRIALMDKGRILQVGTPGELYFKPASLFAATFLGASNILKGTASAADTSISLVGGELIKLTAKANHSGKINILVRPESIRLRLPSQSVDAENQLSGRLKMTVMLGGTTTHQVELNDGSVITVQELTSGERAEVAIGSAVKLAWNAASTIVIPDGQSGQ